MTWHQLKTPLKWLLAAIFIVGGIGHFVATATYQRLMPPGLPYPRELVLVSGVIECALGLGLLVPRTQRVAAWLLIPTLIAIFPANVYAALTADTPQAAMGDVPGWVAWGRLPLQAVLIAWAWWYTREP